MKRSIEYQNGFDAAKNGSNTDNCHFKNFATVQQKDDWQHGYINGLRAKKRQEQKLLTIGGVKYAALYMEFKPPQ
jgi:hypothetical protein